MVFLIFLASVVAMEWIVRRQPGLSPQNRPLPGAEDKIEAPAATSSADIASLAKALAERGSGAKPAPAEEPVVTVRSPRRLGAIERS